MGITLILATTPEILDHCKRTRLSNAKALPGNEFICFDDFISKVTGLKYPQHKILNRQQQVNLLKKVIEKLKLENWNISGTRSNTLDLIVELRRTKADISKLPDNSFHGKEFKSIFEAYNNALGENLDQANIEDAFSEIINKKESWPSYLRQIDEVILCGFGNPAFDPLLKRLVDAIKNKFKCSEIKFDARKSDMLTDVFDAMSTCSFIGNNEQCPEELEIIEYPSAGIEIRSAAKRIAAMLAGMERADNRINKPAKPEDILLVIPEDKIYKRLLRDELETYGIPHDIHTSESLADSMVGIFAINIAEIISLDKLEWKHIQWLLSNSIISFGALKKAGDKASSSAILDFAASANLKRASIATWKNTGDQILEAVASRLKENDKVPEESGEYKNLQEIKPVYEAVLKSLQEILKQAAKPETLKQWCACLKTTLKAFGIMGKLQAAENNNEVKNLNLLNALLDTSSTQKTAEEKMDSKDFIGWLEDALSAMPSASEKHNYVNPVSVRYCTQVENSSWPYVFAIGMNDGSFPQYASYPLILDEATTEKAGLEKLDSQNKRFIEATLNSLKAVSDKLFISYAGNGMDGKRVLPSVLIQNLRESLADERERDDKKFKSFYDSKWLKKQSTELLLPSSVNAISCKDALAANRLADAPCDNKDVRNLIEFCKFWENPANGTGSEYHEFGALPSDTVLKPSSLDNFGACPYKYFASTILNLNKKDDPDLDPDVMTIGSCIHRALELQVSKYLARKDFFICNFLEDAKKNDEIFKTELNQEIDNAFKGLHGFSSDLMKITAGKWKKTLAYLTESIFYMKYENIYIRLIDHDCFIHKLEEILEKIKEKQQGTSTDKKNVSKAEPMLAEILAGAKEMERFPSGFARLFKDLKKYIVPLYIPVSCEYKVKDGGNPYELKIGDKVIKISGKIDRIDLAENGKEKLIRIADYKSGKKQELATKVRKWKKFQVPVYALVARQMIEQKREAYLENATVSDAGTIALNENALHEMLQCSDKELAEFEKMLLTAHENILKGKFAPAPKEYCPFSNYTGNCEYSALCRGTMIDEGKFSLVYPELTPGSDEATDTESEKE